MPSPRILQNKFYLYLTEFFAGMSVMAVELGASRLLAPYFSSSQIVWTIIIGTIMIAMALGNIYGGKTADADPNPDRLYRRILIAAIWIAAIPVVGKYLILGISALLIFTVSQGFLIAAAFAACMVIFVFPLFLLGTVTPSLVKYTTESLDESGRIVGRLGAANTIGSIIGTFTPTFVTIPAVGTSVTFLIFAGILLTLAVVYFLSGYLQSARSSGERGTKTGGTGDRRANAEQSVSAAHTDPAGRGDPVGCGDPTGRKALLLPLLALLLFLLCCIFGRSTSFAFWETGLTYEGESVYNYLQVKENDREVVLSTNVLFGVQSVYEKTESLTGMYYDYALAAPFMIGDRTVGNAAEDASDDAESAGAGTPADGRAENPVSVLILGNGSGTYAAMCRRYLPDVVVEGVEIDAKITDLAHRYFALPADMPVAEYDGRAYLQAVDASYDVIMVDAYQDITIPFQMSSAEFFTLVRDHLNPGGVMVVNMNMRGDGEDSINHWLADTIASVFDEVATVDVPGATNRELFAVMHGGTGGDGGAESGETAEERAAQAGADGTTEAKAARTIAERLQNGRLQLEKSLTDAAEDPAQKESLTEAAEDPAQGETLTDTAVDSARRESLMSLLDRVQGGLVSYEGGGRILTDDRAPVELLGMRLIDELIADEVAYYKGIYEQEGIQGLLERL